MTGLSLIVLAVAILCEVGGAVAARMVSVGGRRGRLGVVLAEGMPLGGAYGLWAAAGVAITAVISRVFFKEPLTWIMGAGLVLIVGGVLLIETGAAH